MFHLKTLVKNPAIKQEVSSTISKLLPIASANLASSRNYADHKIPDRLKDVATARGK